MADRYPLIVDINDGNKIKELPAADNLNLQNSGLINADSIQTATLDTTEIYLNGNLLDESNIAFTEDYNQLNNKPDLSIYVKQENLPVIPTSLQDLQDDVANINPQNGQTLVFDAITGKYQPENIEDRFDITNYSIGGLQDVVLSGNLNNRYLKNINGAWQPSLITWAEIQNRPLQNSRFENDSGYLNPTTLDSYITTDNTITYANGTISVSSSSITTDQISVSGTGTIGDSLQSAGNGSFVWRNPYVEQETEPANPLPGDEWLETVNNIYYKYMGGHWIPIVQYNVIETENGVEINTESGDAIDFGN